MRFFKNWKANRKFWILTETMDATIQTGPFSSRHLARKHRRHCTSLCKAPWHPIVRHATPPVLLTTVSNPSSH